MKRSVVVVLAVALCAVPGCAPPGESNPAAEQAAIAAAEKWLELTDNGRYDESWEQASAFLKAVIPKPRWLENIEPRRDAMGKMVSRTLTSTRYATSLPSAPDGEYVMIQYQTVFENKKSAVETITPMLDKDGKWRVFGYFIQ